MNTEPDLQSEMSRRRFMVVLAGVTSFALDACTGDLDQYNLAARAGSRYHLDIQINFLTSTRVCRG